MQEELKLNLFSALVILLYVLWLGMFVVVNRLLLCIAKQISTDISGIQPSYSYRISIGVISSFLYLVYDIFLDFLEKASRDFDVFAILELGLLLLNLVLYGILSGYILFLAITKMLVPLPKRYFYWYNLLTFRIQ
jgi:hypothetical protein